MAEDGGVCVRRSGKEKGTWLGIGQRVEEKRGDSWGLGCSIHPSAGLSRCVPGELGSWDRVVGGVIIISGVKVAYMRMGRVLG